MLNTLGLAAVVAAVASSLGWVEPKDLAAQAELIVYGRVADIERRVEMRSAGEGAIPVTVASARIEPLAVVKGAKPRRIMVVAVESGEDGPRFEKGKNAVLFLSRNSDRSSYSTVGQIQGKFDVESGTVLRTGDPVGRFIANLEQYVSD